MRVSLIIAAGGTGSRFKAGLKRRGGKTQPAAASKLFHSLGGVPLLLRTLQAFQALSEVHETILALPPGLDRLIRGWVRDHGLKSIRCVRGGMTRFESVSNALKKVSSGSWVMIHDGARPLVEPAAVKKLLRLAAQKKWDAALLARKVVPTIKQVPPGGKFVSQTLDRETLYEAETPQLFRRAAIQKAIRHSIRVSAPSPTDEALLMETAGYRVHLVEHEGWNPKITTVQDLELAESFLHRKDDKMPRIGFGSDTHRLIAGRRFLLGGVRLEAAYGPLGHSDGDALLHALIDALLGAAALGDIGDFFSDKAPQNKNRSSAEMLQETLGRLSTAGWKPVQVDSVVHLERPRLGLSKTKIAAHVAKLLGLAPGAVSIKAKTFEGVGTGGAGLLVRCEVLAVIERK